MTQFIEPELLGPTPRRVVAKRGLLVARGAVLALAVFFAWRWSADSRSPVRTVLWIIVLAGICWGPFELGIFCKRRYLRIGRVTEGHILDLRRERSWLRALTEFLFYFAGHFHYGSTLRIHYRYPVAEDRWREVKRSLDDESSRGIGGPGDVVTVLVDPTNPRRHALYPTLLQWLRVESAPDT